MGEPNILEDILQQFRKFLVIRLLCLCPVLGVWYWFGFGLCRGLGPSRLPFLQYLQYFLHLGFEPIKVGIQVTGFGGGLIRIIPVSVPPLTSFSATGSSRHAFRGRWVRPAQGWIESSWRLFTTHLPIISIVYTLKALNDLMCAEVWLRSYSLLPLHKHSHSNDVKQHSKHCPNEAMWTDQTILGCHHRQQGFVTCIDRNPWIGWNYSGRKCLVFGVILAGNHMFLGWLSRDVHETFLAEAEAETEAFWPETEASSRRLSTCPRRDRDRGV